MEASDKARRRRVLVTRGAENAGTLAFELEQRGMEVVSVPAIEAIAPESFVALDAALGKLAEFDWLAFTSATAVEWFARRAALLRIAWPENLQVAVVGAATARAAEANGMRVSLVPPRAVAESLAEALMTMWAQAGQNRVRVLFPRAESGREVLPERLRAAGHEVVMAPAYRTVVPVSSAALLRTLFARKEDWPDAVTFTSASTVRNLRELLGAAGVELPKELPRVSIGPVTSAALAEVGWSADAEAPDASVAALAETVQRVLGGGMPAR